MTIAERLPPLAAEGAERLAYRADIDVLRGVAILVVVGHHVGLPTFENGFVGVDVFFAVSGFLITSLLWRQLTTSGSIQWSEFYAQRVRRLVPALALVLVGSLLIGAAVLLPWERQPLGTSAASASAFVSNLFFWRRRLGYFTPPSESAPLLHTWSLGVEEQFYVIWPTFLLIVWHASRRRPGRVVAVATIAAVTAMSLGLAVIVSARSQEAAFYLLPTRLWQLGAGGALAVAVAGRSGPSAAARRAGSALGVLLLGAAFVLLPDAVGHPTVPGLAAVVGTVLLLWLGEPSPTGRRQRAPWRALVGIGRVSYGWYLWHWPLLTIARSYWGERDTARDLAVSAGAFALAVLSYRFVEQPIRQQRRPAWHTPRNALLAGSLLVAGCVAASLVVAEHGAALSITSPPDVTMAAIERAHASGWPCATNDPLQTHPSCATGRPLSKAIVAIGDSHAGAFMAGVVLIANRTKRPYAAAWRPTCPFIQGLEPGPHNTCREHNTSELAALLAHPPAAVIWLARYDRYFPTAPPGQASWSSVEATLDGRAIGAGSGADDARRMAQATAASLQRLTDAGIPVLVVLPVPELPTAAPACLARRAAARCGIDERAARRYRDPVVDPLVEALRANDLVTVWDPFLELCRAGRCRATDGARALYRDDNHLSDDGARLLADHLLPVLDRMLPAS